MKITMDDHKAVSYARHTVPATTRWETFQNLIRRCLRVETVFSGKLPAAAQMLLLFCAAGLLQLPASGSAHAMTRTLKEEPAIVIAAFGTTTRAQVTFDYFEKQLRESLPARYKNLEIAWAFTSEIVRESANKRFREQGIDKR